MDRLDKVVHELRAFVAGREWEQFHDPKNLAMAVASEAGELLAEYRWVSNTEVDDYSRGERNWGQTKLGSDWIFLQTVLEQAQLLALDRAA